MWEKTNGRLWLVLEKPFQSCGNVLKAVKEKNISTKMWELIYIHMKLSIRKKKNSGKTYIHEKKWEILYFPFSSNYAILY